VRILANENIAGDVIDLLRQRGHDVAWVRTDNPGTDDNSVLARSVAEDRLLITFDKDLGELVFRRGARASAGVVLFRLAVLPPAALARRISDVLDGRADWSGHFTVVDDRRIRMVPLQGGQ